MTRFPKRIQLSKLEVLVGYSLPDNYKVKDRFLCFRVTQIQRTGSQCKPTQSMFRSVRQRFQVHELGCDKDGDSFYNFKKK